MQILKQVGQETMEKVGILASELYATSAETLASLSDDLSRTMKTNLDDYFRVPGMGAGADDAANAINGVQSPAARHAKLARALAAILGQEAAERLVKKIDEKAFFRAIGKINMGDVRNFFGKMSGMTRGQVAVAPVAGGQAIAAGTELESQASTSNSVKTGLVKAVV